VTVWRGCVDGGAAAVVRVVSAVLPDGADHGRTSPRCAIVDGAPALWEPALLTVFPPGCLFTGDTPIAGPPPRPQHKL